MHELPYPPDFDINYHQDLEVQRVARAKRLIDVGAVLAILDARMAAERDPQQHPLAPLVEFYLDRRTAVDGGAFYDRCKQLVLAAIDTALDDAFEALGED
jgi:hypothetical protein